MLGGLLFAVVSSFLVLALLKLPPFIWFDDSASETQVEKLAQEFERQREVSDHQQAMLEDYRDILRSTLPGGLKDLAEQAKVAAQSGRLEDARVTLERVTALAITPEEKTSAALDLGSILLALQRAEEAKVQIEIALTSSDQAADRSIRANTAGTAALFYETTGSLERSEALFLETLQIFKTYSDDVGEAKTLHNIGNLLLLKNDTARAISYFESALVINQSIGRASGEVRNLVQLAYIYRFRGDTLRAQEAYQQALAKATDLAEPVLITATAQSLAGFQREIHFYDDALVNAHIALGAARQSGNAYLEVDILGLIGNIYLGAGLLNDARFYHTQAIELSALHKFRDLQSVALIDLSSTFLREGNLAFAEEKAKQALAIAVDVKRPDIQFEALNILFAARFRSEDYRGSAQYLCSANKLQSSLSSRQILTLALNSAILSIDPRTCP